MRSKGVGVMGLAHSALQTAQTSNCFSEDGLGVGGKGGVWVHLLAIVGNRPCVVSFRNTTESSVHLKASKLKKTADTLFEAYDQGVK